MSAEIDDDAAGEAANHLYWSRARSNKPPPPKTTQEAKASVSDAPLSDKVWTPIFKWGQKRDRVVLTIFVPCLEKEALTVDIKPKSLSFRAERVAVFAGNAKEQRIYTLELKLLAEVDADGAEISLRHDNVRVTLRKEVAAPWRTLQSKGIPKHPNERPDFDLIGDEDNDEDDDVLCRPVPQKNPARAQGGASGGGVTAAFSAVSRLIAPLLKLNVYEWLLVSLALVHVGVCPYNKVEESFGLQATHDVLFHRFDLSAYDHHDFPGVVPRTFLGPLVLAACSSPLVGLLSLLSAPKLYALYAVRGTLGLLSAMGLIGVLRATRRHYGYDAMRALSLLSATQFHYLFYCSRTLPNTFAALLVLPATAAWIDGDVRRVLRLLTVAAVVFRAELVLLLGPLALTFLVGRRVGFVELLRVGFGTAFAALALTVAVDSLFWRRLLYPEGEVLYFNTVLNKSGEYGTAPFHWYFTSALPRAMLLALPLSLAAPFLVPRTRALVALPLLFVAVYSILPHKELRFVLYALPPLNVAAAAAAAKLYHLLPSTADGTKDSMTLGLFGRLLGAMSLVASFGVACLFWAAAAHNYPGALALHHAHALGASTALRGRPIHVHVGVEAAMSGVSRFLELPSPWRYSKAEGLDAGAGDYKRFAYVLARPGTHLPGFSPVHMQSGFDRISAAPPFFHYEPKVAVLRRQAEQIAGKSSGGDFGDL